ncbi:MAG: DUF1778 domain-containing protein [bacterium]
MSRVSCKDDRLDLRIQKSQKSFLIYAASLCQMKLSNFVLHSAFKMAEEIVTEKAHFALSEEQWGNFCEALDRPARNIPELKKLFAKKTVFDG